MCPPFFLQGVAPNGVTNGPIVSGLFLCPITGRNVYTLSSVQSSLRARCVVVREMNSSLLGRIRGSEAMPRNQSKCGWCAGRSRAMRCNAVVLCEAISLHYDAMAYSETRKVPCAYMPYKSQAGLIGQKVCPKMDVDPGQRPFFIVKLKRNDFPARTKSVS